MTKLVWSSIEEFLRITNLCKTSTKQTSHLPWQSTHPTFTDLTFPDLCFYLWVCRLGLCQYMYDEKQLDILSSYFLTDVIFSCRTNKHTNSLTNMCSQAFVANATSLGEIQTLIDKNIKQEDKTTTIKVKVN